MPEVKEGQEVIDTELLRIIADTEDIVRKFSESDDYKRLVENSEKFRKELAEDDEQMSKTGKPKYSYDQRRLLCSEMCAIGAFDASLANLGNISALHHHVEYSIESFKRQNEKAVEEKKE